MHYGGGWRDPHGRYACTLNPATGESLGACAEADAEDVEAAARAAHGAFAARAALRPRERGAMLKTIAGRLRAHAGELALVDAANGGNPIAEMVGDVARAQAAYVWINTTGRHFLGAPFGGHKQSGQGREESLDELLSYRQVMNVHVAL